MKTTETEINIEPVTILCRILCMPIKHWLTVIAIILFSIAPCVVVFAGEPVKCTDSRMFEKQAEFNCSNQYAGTMKCFDLNQLHANKMFDTISNNIGLFRCCDKYSYLVKTNEM